MPTFAPKTWRDAATSNNCYNYAVDHKFEGPCRSATPGTTRGIFPGVLRHAIPDGKGDVVLVWEFTCTSILTSCEADGLEAAPKSGTCKDGCWRIAYFIRPYRAPTRTRSGDKGDYHFVREDTPGSWSHKPNNAATLPTQRQYNPKTNTYDGPRISDPEKDNVGPDYRFCGYLCCCPDQEVAIADPVGASSESVAVSVGGDQSGFPSMIAPHPWTQVRTLALATAAELDLHWRSGVGSTGLLLRVNGPDIETLDGERVVSSLLVDETAITLYDPEPRTVTDHRGRASRAIIDAFSSGMAVEPLPTPGGVGDPYSDLVALAERARALGAHRRPGPTQLDIDFDLRAERPGGEGLRRKKKPTPGGMDVFAVDCVDEDLPLDATHLHGVFALADEDSTIGVEALSPPPGDSRDRADIRAWLEKLLADMAEAGIETGPLGDALDEHEYHEESVDTRVTRRDGAAAVTFFPGWTFYDWQLINVFDEHTHTVLGKEDADAIANDGARTNRYGLTGPAKTAIHELLHAMIHRTECFDPNSANEEELVTLLEELISDTVGYRNAAAAGLGANAVKILRQSINAAAARIATLGGQKCMRALGLGPVS